MSTMSSVRLSVGLYVTFRRRRFGATVSALGLLGLGHFGAGRFGAALEGGSQ